MVLDPGEKLCPFGSLNWRHSYARGIGQSAQGLSVLTTPSQNYRDNVTTRKGDIYFDAQGGITGRIMITMSGQAALRWRQVALRNDIDEVKKQFDRDLQQIVPDGVDAHVDHFLGMDSPSSLLMAVVDVKGTLGTATAKRRLIPGYFFETRGHVPFVKEENGLSRLTCTTAKSCLMRSLITFPTESAWKAPRRMRKSRGQVMQCL